MRHVYCFNLSLRMECLASSVSSLPLLVLGPGDRSESAPDVALALLGPADQVDGVRAVH